MRKLSANAVSTSVSDTKSASAVYNSGSASAWVSAGIRDSFSEWHPPTATHETFVCASVSKSGKWDSGCGILPVVIDSQLGAAQVSGSISAANCIYLYCPRGVITVNATWTATGNIGPVPPGVPYFCFDPFLTCANVSTSFAVARSATSVGSVASTYAGTVAGSDSSASIRETLSFYVSAF